jgi:hypothetical protein
VIFNKNVNIAAAAVVAGLIFGVARPGRAQALHAEMKDSILYLWVQVVKGGLAMRGESFFEPYIKDAALPGPDPHDTGTHPADRFFKAKIISMTPAIGPKELSVGIEKADVADAKLRFRTALPGKMEPGEEIEFWGAAADWSHDPKNVVVTFDIDDPKTELKGWTGRNAPTKAAPKSTGPRLPPPP